MHRATRSRTEKTSQEDFAAFLREKRRGGSPPPLTPTDSESETFFVSPTSGTDTEEWTSPEQIRSKSRSNAELYHSALQSEQNRSRPRTRSVVRTEKPPKARNAEPEPQKRSLSRTKTFPSAVNFEKDRSLERTSKRPVSRRREADEDDDYRGTNATYSVTSTSRQRSHSRNHASKFLVLEIKKIRGMKKFPIVQPYSANMKLRITVTFRGIAKVSPQISRTGEYDQNNLTFMWKISTAEARIIEDQMEFHAKLTIERDESQGKRKWTHIVGETYIPGKTGVTIGGGPYKVDLVPTVEGHGRQQLEFRIDLRDNEQY